MGSSHFTDITCPWGAGADSGIFVRDFREIFDKQKKKKKKKEKRREETEGFGCSFPSVEWWFKSTFQTIIYIQVYFR